MLASQLLFVQKGKKINGWKRNIVRQEGGKKKKGRKEGEEGESYCFRKVDPFFIPFVPTYYRLYTYSVWLSAIQPVLSSSQSHSFNWKCPSKMLLPFLCTALWQDHPIVLESLATIDCLANNKTKNAHYDETVVLNGNMVMIQLGIAWVNSHLEKHVVNVLCTNKGNTILLDQLSFSAHSVSHSKRCNKYYIHSDWPT